MYEKLLDITACLIGFIFNTFHLIASMVFIVFITGIPLGLLLGFKILFIIKWLLLSGVFLGNIAGISFFLYNFSEKEIGKPYRSIKEGAPMEFIYTIIPVSTGLCSVLAVITIKLFSPVNFSYYWIAFAFALGITIGIIRATALLPSLISKKNA